MKITSDMWENRRMTQQEAAEHCPAAEDSCMVAEHGQCTLAEIHQRCGFYLQLQELKKKLGKDQA